MIILKGASPKLPGPNVLAIGKFECIHRGHRALLGEVVRLAQSNPLLASAMLVFEPHPARVLFDPGYKPLFTGPEREFLAGRLGLDYLLEYPFDRAFAAMSPAYFCRLLFEEMQVRILVVGEGYRFGHNREGTVATLEQAARERNAKIHIVSPAAHGLAPAKISTSTIRALLAANQLPEAESLLGYPFFVQGTVTPGRQLGRTIGFPTLNLYPPEGKFLPGNGVYATRTILEGQSYKSITNIGTRPTVAESSQISVETHLIGYTGGELYGKEVHVDFLRFIRPERKFESLEALKAQIMEDLGHG